MFPGVTKRNACWRMVNESERRGLRLLIGPCRVGRFCGMAFDWAEGSASKRVIDARRGRGQNSSRGGSGVAAAEARLCARRWLPAAGAGLGRHWLPGGRCSRAARCSSPTRWAAARSWPRATACDRPGRCARGRDSDSARGAQVSGTCQSPWGAGQQPGGCA